MVSSRIFPSPVGWVLGVLLCLSCTWPVIGSSEMASVSKDLCYYGYCENDGTCLNIKGSPVCFCPDYYTGNKCQYLDVCIDRFPCGDDGHCHVIDSFTYQCDCKDGFTGKKCYTETLESSQCASVTCWNGGTCYNDKTTIDGTYCICRDHYHGPFCENFTTCGGIVCQNGGTCNDDNGDAVCLCPILWRGQYCQISTFNDPCGVWSTCLNGGTCYSDLEDVYCDCQEGFRGETCEIEDSPTACADWTCHNGGSCSTDTWGNANCECDGGWHGDHCENGVDIFLTGVPTKCGTCLNGGLCLSSGGGGMITCSCPQDYTGPSCEISTESAGSQTLAVMAIAFGVLLVIGLKAQTISTNIHNCAHRDHVDAPHRGFHPSSQTNILQVYSFIFLANRSLTRRHHAYLHLGCCFYRFYWRRYLQIRPGGRTDAIADFYFII